MLSRISIFSLSTLLLILYSGYGHALKANPFHVRYVDPTISDNDSRDTYYVQLLKLALEKTEESHGPFTLEAIKLIANRERKRVLVSQNKKIDVLWSSSNPLREKQNLAIKFPLLKQLSSYRILLIRKGEQPKFSEINSIDDLRNLKAGSGTYWHDTQVLQKNNIPLVDSMERHLLYKMLLAERFDYISRGLYEIHETNDTLTQLKLANDLEYEQSLLLNYNTPFYFFVNKSNISLSNRIYQGLTAAKNDGSFDILFNMYPEHSLGLSILNSKNRKIIHLD